jgi:N4-gp56 family major capsid protein
VLNQYTDLTPRQTAYHVVETLKRLRPQIVLGRFAQFQKTLPKKTTDVVKWVRYRKIANAGVLSEGVPPAGKQMTSDTITAKLEQLGDVIKMTDVALDLHPDDLMAEAQDMLDEQLLDTMERIYVDNIRGGSQVIYSNSETSRGAVAADISAADLRKALLTLKKNNSKPVGRMLTGDVAYKTTPVEKSYIAYCPVEFEPYLRDINTFETSDKYAGQTELYTGEFGKFENCRFITSTLANSESTELVGAGAAGVDVGQIVMFGQEAYGGVPFAGPNAMELYVRMPRSTVGDELAQQAYVGWKTRFNAAIIQQKSLIRVEAKI